jgi:hypothetical protein
MLGVFLEVQLLYLHLLYLEIPAKQQELPHFRISTGVLVDRPHHRWWKNSGRCWRNRKRGPVAENWKNEEMPSNACGAATVCCARGAFGDRGPAVC